MALGNKGNNGENGDVKFVNISFGKFWIDSEDKENPNWLEREWEVAGRKGVKTGLAYTEVSGKLSGFKFYDLQFGNQLKVYIKDEDETYCVNFKLDKAYGKFDMVKKMMLALMFIDKDKEMTLNQITNKVGDKEYYNFWIGQEGKSLRLNPEKDEATEAGEKHIAIPESVMDEYMALEIPFSDEFKAMDKDTQEYKRAEGLKAMRALLEMNYMESEEESEQKKEVEQKEETTSSEPEKEAEAPEEEVADNTQEETPRERRLRELRERKAKK